MQINTLMNAIICQSYPIMTLPEWMNWKWVCWVLPCRPGSADTPSPARPAGSEWPPSAAVCRWSSGRWGTSWTASAGGDTSVLETQTERWWHKYNTIYNNTGERRQRQLWMFNAQGGTVSQWCSSNWGSGFIINIWCLSWPPTGSCSEFHGLNENRKTCLLNPAEGKQQGI